MVPLPHVSAVVQRLSCTGSFADFHRFPLRYDYSHPIADAVEGITHSLCTLEFEDHRPL